MVGEVHVMIVAQLDCAKYTRQREEDLFSNIKKKKSAPIFFFKKLRKTNDVIIILIAEYCMYGILYVVYSKDFELISVLCQKTLEVCTRQSEILLVCDF